VVKPFDDQTLAWMNDVEQQVDGMYTQIDSVIDINQWKVIQAFQKHQVSDYHFASSSGYGYNDRGREVLDLVYADVFNTESALVRPHFVSGTHTISIALFGLLRPGDHLLYITGKPYDTLHHVIGQPHDGSGSLQDWGIHYDEVNLTDSGEPHWHAIRELMKPHTKVIGIQRSRGYTWRPSFSVSDIAKMVAFVKEINPDVIVFVDNCYGEFTEILEPTDVGVDVMAGSLIKNPGGGLAPSGGYIVGRSKLVDYCAARLTAPGIGAEVGAMLGSTKPFFQGLFLAPHMVGQAVRGAIFAAAMFEKLGFQTSPKWNEQRTDLIQAIQFSNAEQVIAFVQGIQKGSAVDAHVVPVPWNMPGYAHPVIMAAGTFIQGGSLELSADAPIREPYIAYVQGGLTYAHCKYGVLTAVEHMRASHLL
jgi:cystathionine beta-lyase family protein involved in aluminum resistance